VTTLDPVTDFVTSQAVYQITIPSGSCSLPFYLVDNVGDGRAAVATLAVRDVQSVFPCRCNFTLYLEN